MLILALDLGKFNTMCCLFETKTRKHEFINVATDRMSLSTLLKKNKCDLVVMEACGPSGWISDLCAEHKRKTLVCSTNEDAWKWSNVKRKTDKDDALKLARMAAMNELKAVHMPTPGHREFRSLVKYRKTLDRRINRIKNTIRSFFVNHGINIDRGAKAWCTGRKLIDSYRKAIAECGPTDLWKGELDIELTLMDALAVQLQGIEKKLELIGKNDPRIVRLRTVPGIGPRTAEILVACIDDPHRFKNGRQVSAYFGLVPKQYQSGETDRNGRITKRGNPLARTILVECAWASLRYNPWARGVYDRICGKQKTRKKKAGIALARKIAVLGWAMLRDEKDWDPAIMNTVTASYARDKGRDSKQPANERKQPASPASQDTTSKPSVKRSSSGALADKQQPSSSSLAAKRKMGKQVIQQPTQTNTSPTSARSAAKSPTRKRDLIY